MVQEGEALKYYGTGPAADGGRPHTCVILKIDESKNEVCLVPISSEMSNYDPACSISPDEKWKPITRPSFCAYYDAKISSLSGIGDQLKSGRVVSLGLTPSRIFQRIKAGVFISENTEPFFEKALKNSAEAKGRVLYASDANGT